MYTLAVVESISLVRPFMNHQLTQHKPTTQWSDTLGSQHQQMSRQYPPSQYQIASHQSSSLAASLSPLQVSFSTMQLQSSKRPQSLPTTHTSSIRRHTQYTLNAHQFPEPPDIGPEIPSNHSWQTVKKRKRTYPSTISATRGYQPPFNSPNSFAELSHLSDDDIQASASALHATISSDQATQLRVHKPPPIYVYCVTNYCDMVKYLAGTLEEEQYYCKALPNATAKINVNTSDTYRRLVKRLQEDNIVHHTYQIRDESVYRVVLRNLHHSIPPHEIQAELETLGHKVRNVLNIRHRVTKEPLPLYFADLKPQDNNKSI